MSKRRKGKYRDSKHYREYRTKAGNTASVYTGGTTSKTVKSSGSDAYGGYTGGSRYSSWGMCTTMHRMTPIDVGEGLTIFATAWSDSVHRITYKGGDKGMTPDVGIYLDDAWAALGGHLTTPGLRIPGLDGSTHEYLIYSWPDYDVPRDIDEFKHLCRWTLDMLRSGKIIETGCFAGHGRTGTFLAGLMVMQGTSAQAAIASVREQQCKKCVETASQREWLFDLDEEVNGREAPKQLTLDSELTTPLLDEFGRRIPANELLNEAVLNELEAEEAYETWLRLNSTGYGTDDWCDYEDLPINLCMCPDKMEDVEPVCFDGPCAMRDVCAGGECFAHAMQTGMVIS